MTDNFILRQLRGWRLLSGAHLSTEDVRSVMASTNNRLDYDNISVALTILFDEQLQSSSRHGGHHGPQMFTLEEKGWDEDHWHGWDPWANASEWWNDEDPTWSYYDSEAAYGDTDPGGEGGAEEQGGGEGELQSADRSWSQAQRSTQMMKKDRGFGGVASQSGKGNGKTETCHICGSPQHFARDCPDRQSPFGRSKGFGKNQYYVDDEAAFAFFKGKGKSRPFGGKGNHYLLDELYYMKGKSSGKSKGKGKPKGKNKGTVNAYYSEWGDYYGYGVEFDGAEEMMDLQANVSYETPKPQPMGKHFGMLDTGATCSAGPESSIKKMIAAVLEKDSKAKLTFDMKKRPRFRFGSRRWGRALYKVTMSSSLSPASFSAYALPDPEEVGEPWFHEGLLVPVLIGMDFIHNHGLIVDFNDGFSVCSKHRNAQPFHLHRNEKGHYMLNIADFVTNGKSCDEGSPEIHVLLDEDVSEAQFRHSLSLSTLMFEDEEEGHEVQVTLETSHSEFHELWSRRQLMDDHSSSFMGSLVSFCDPTTSSPRSSFRHGAQEEDQHYASGLIQSDGGRSERSSKLGSGVAMLREPQPGETSRKSMGSLGSLQPVRSSNHLHSEGRSTCVTFSVPESRQREDGFDSASRGVGTPSGTQCRVGEGDDREGDCRGAHEDSSTGIQGPSEEGGDECGKGSQSLGEALDWASEFRLRGLKREGEQHPDDSKGDDKLGSGEPRKEPTAVSNRSRTSRSTSKDCRKDGRSSTSTSGRRDGTRISSRDDARSACSTMKDKADVIENDKVITHPLPLRVGRAMMETINGIQEDLNADLATVVYDSKPVTWELFCSPESELSKQSDRYGFKAVRINLANGYDLYKAETYEKLKGLCVKQRPRRIWVSPRCTYYCSWVDLNYAHRWPVLEAKRRKERRMLRMLTAFLLWVLELYPDVELCWEWPQRCRGWKEAVVLQFIEALRALNRDPWFCRVDGCRFGLKSENGGFILKPWYILTTDIHFYHEFRLRVCVKNHEHEWLHGVETTRSAYYPKAMCVAIARNWQRQLIPQRWFTMLWSAPCTLTDPFKELYVNEEVDMDYEPTTDAEGEEQQEDGGDEEHVTEEEKERWKVKLMKLHKAAGHPTSRNMARMLSDAQAPRWKVRMALSFSCPVCQEVRPGGSSSGQVPPGSMRPMPTAWEHLGMDVGEWTVPNQDKKIKFLLMMDLATRFKVVEPMFVYKHGENKVESADDIIRVTTSRWLMDKPRPKVVVPDNAKSLTSQKFADFLSDLNIQLMPPPDNESWSHGVVERAIGQLKVTCERIQLAAPDQNPLLTLGLAAAALNSTEYVKGFSSIQWAYGRQAELDDDQLRQQLSLPLDRQQHEYLRLLQNREMAEEAARKSKAVVVLGKL